MHGQQKVTRIYMYIGYIYMYIYMYTGMGEGGPKCRNLQMKISAYSYNNKSTTRQLNEEYKAKGDLNACNFKT